MPEVLRSYFCLAISNAKVTFKKYSIVKITGNGHRKGAEQSVKVFFDALWRG